MEQADWSRSTGVIRMGVRELTKSPERLWCVIAHELAHPESVEAGGHSLAYRARFAEGLKRAGRLDLLRRGISYREGALRVAREYGLAGLPPVWQFSSQIGEVVVDHNGTRWVVPRRFRRIGRPYYQLEFPGWRWTDAEEAVLSYARREAVRVDQDKDAMPMLRRP